MEQEETKSSTLSDSQQKESNQPLECRICFQSDLEAVQGMGQQPSRSPSMLRLLQKPCSCKGSLSYVHEACLVRWLLQRNIRHCELCHTRFIIKEEMASISDVIRHSVSQLLNNKRRIFKTAIYSIYIYLFVKRFFGVLKYFLKTMTDLVSKQAKFIR